MATTLEQVFATPRISRGLSGDQIVVAYRVRALPGDAELTYEDAEDYYIANGVTEFDGLPRAEYTIEAEDWQVWRVTAVFETPNLLSRPSTPARPQSAGASVVNFGVRTDTARVRNAVALRSVSKLSGLTTSAPDFGTLVNVNESGAEGVDIRVPVMTREETWLKPASAITNTYINTIAALTGTTNDSTFRGNSAGSVLFLGATGQQLDTLDYQITYSFEIRPNEASVTLSPGLTVSNVRGHDYVWVYYEPTVDTGAQRVARVPIAAYVTALYTSGNFGSLNL